MALVLFRDLHFIWVFIVAITWVLLTLTFHSDIVKIGAHIKLSPLYYKTHALTNLDLHP